MVLRSLLYAPLFVPLVLIACSHPPVQDVGDDDGGGGGDACCEEADVGGDSADLGEPAAILSITPDLDPFVIGVGYSVTLRARLHGVPAQQVEWSSTSDTITIDPDGRITGVSSGGFEVRVEHTESGVEGVLVGTVKAPRWVAVEAGSANTCAIDGDGALYCFGRLDYLRQENTLPVGSSSPVQIPTPEKVREVAIANWAMCIVGESGTVYCRGYNERGALGDGSRVSRSTWAPILSESTFSGLEAGERDFCAISDLGLAFCWGEVASGSPTGTLTPRRMDDQPMRAVFAGDWHMCGIDHAQNAFCWGGNLGGQLGDGTREYAYFPTPVLGDHTFEFIAAGRFFSCGVDDGVTFCWGYEEFGVLGIEVRQGLAPTPQPNGVRDVVSMDAEFHAACAIDAYGTRVCWGKNDHGVIGDGTFEERSPVYEDREHVWARVALGTQHACGLSIQGDLYCWGADQWGATGSGRPLATAAPQDLGAGWKAVSAGVSHTCAITDNGDAQCWGENGGSQLGLGHSVWTPWGGRISTVSGFDSIAAAGSVSCGTADGTLYCWGLDTQGGLGLETTHLAVIPSEVPLSDATEVRASVNGFIARNAAEQWFRWGNGTSSPRRLYNVPHEGETWPMADVSLGQAHHCALLAGTDGAAVCYGEDDLGRLGPLETSGTVWDGSWSEVSAGLLHTCARAVSGEVTCWGVLDADNETLTAPAPLPVPGELHGLTSKGPFTCAIADDGSARCWGTNRWGNLGTAPSAAHMVPHRVDVGSAFVTLSAGGRHACGITEDTHLWCWGDTSFGQTGLLDDGWEPVPRLVERPDVP